MAVGAGIRPDGGQMHHIFNTVLRRQLADPPRQFRLQRVKALAATLEQNTHKIDHRIRRGNHLFKICIRQRIAGHHRHLPDNAHGFQEFRPLGIAAQNDDSPTGARQHFNNRPPDKARPANHCCRLFHRCPLFLIPVIGSAP